jgi:hypothetical protein
MLNSEGTCCDGVTRRAPRPRKRSFVKLTDNLSALLVLDFRAAQAVGGGNVVVSAAASIRIDEQQDSEQDEDGEARS